MIPHDHVNPICPNCGEQIAIDANFKPTLDVNRWHVPHTCRPFLTKDERHNHAAILYDLIDPAGAGNSDAAECIHRVYDEHARQERLIAFLRTEILERDARIGDLRARVLRVRTILGANNVDPDLDDDPLDPADDIPDFSLDHEPQED